jgi:hypothetical protein
MRRRSKQLHKQRRLADRSQAEIDQTTVRAATFLANERMGISLLPAKREVIQCTSDRLY